jgi:hypothetical protein
MTYQWLKTEATEQGRHATAAGAVLSHTLRRATYSPSEFFDLQHKILFGCSCDPILYSLGSNDSSYHPRRFYSNMHQQHSNDLGFGFGIDL